MQIGGVEHRGENILYPCAAYQYILLVRFADVPLQPFHSEFGKGWKNQNKIQKNQVNCGISEELLQDRLEQCGTSKELTSYRWDKC